MYLDINSKVNKEQGQLIAVISSTPGKDLGRQMNNN